MSPDDTYLRNCEDSYLAALATLRDVTAAHIANARRGRERLANGEPEAHAEAIEGLTLVVAMKDAEQHLGTVERAYYRERVQWLRDLVQP